MNFESLDPLLVVIFLLNFVLVGLSRLQAVVYTVAIQGVIVGLWPLVMHDHISVRLLALVALTVFLKGWLIPQMIFYAMREVEIQREIQPYLGFVSSLILEVVGTGVALAFAASLPLAPEHLHAMVVPAAFATVFTGFLLLTTRRRAITQVIGYLTLENGILLFGLLLLEAMPLLVEVGVLLDLFVAIFVMRIILNHVSREFASESTEYLSALKD